MRRVVVGERERVYLDFCFVPGVFWSTVMVMKFGGVFIVILGDIYDETDGGAFISYMIKRIMDCVEINDIIRKLVER